MLLKSIKYHNFRPFFGDQEIIFSNKNDDPSKNVVVILGENTHGKSTIILSFIWCLYGENRFNQKDILNKKVQRNMSFGEKEKAWVEVNFSDAGINYTIRRTQAFSMGVNGLQTNENDATPSLTYVDEKTGETKKAKFSHEVETIINSILPKDLAGFFFFEGEKNNEISKKDMGAAVKTLLGLEAYDKMRSHLYGSQTQSTPYSGSVMGIYLEKQKDESGDKAKEEYKKSQDAEIEAEEVGRRLAEIDVEINNYEADIEDVNDILRQAAPTKEIQANRDTIRKSLERENNNLESNIKKFINMFGSDSLPVLMLPFMTMAEKKLSELDVSDKGIKGIEAPAIHALLNRGFCLCGTDLKEGSAAYKNVYKYIDFLPPKNVGTLISEMNESIVDYRERARLFANNFEECYANIQKSISTIDDLEGQDKDLLKKISEIGSVDTSIAEERLANAKIRLNQLRREKDEKIATKTNLETAKENAIKKFNEYKNKSDKAEKYQRYYFYAQAIYNWVNNQYSKKENAMRERLAAYVKELFNNMYSGEREISIDEKYNIVMNYKGGDLDDTGGLRVLQYFAYIGGLVKLAYETMLEREKDDEGNEEVLGEQYPLVLDAAFSHADEKHVVAIAKGLSASTTQLVFAVMRKDWKYAKEGLSGKISKLYELEKISEDEVKIQEVSA